jgi:hypothetical protein
MEGANGDRVGGREGKILSQDVSEEDIRGGRQDGNLDFVKFPEVKRTAVELHLLEELWEGVCV